ncbi:MAG TPA: hypothetical protein VK009_26360, partial [Chloroflexota bacterium]|nr:hypothetical protein [Chloroflexota bacterium]
MKRTALFTTLLLLTATLTPSVANADSASAVVQIGDTTYSAWSVTIPVGGSVTWQNVGGYVHTATSQGPTPSASFDTGGLAPGQSQTLVFTNPGAFTYSSAPDCLNGNANHGFNCEGPYQVFVMGDGSAAPLISAPARPAPATVTVYVDDNDGFQPNTLTVSAGQSIQFV